MSIGGNMKNMIILAGLFLGLPMAHAADLGGKTLSCEYEFFSSSETRSYSFLNGLDEVAIHDSREGRSIANYSLQGSILVIKEDNRTISYDISNPAAVVGRYKDCVTGGVPDGDTRPICATIVHVCSLSN